MTPEKSERPRPGIVPLPGPPAPALVNLTVEAPPASVTAAAGKFKKSKKRSLKSRRQPQKPATEKPQKPATEKPQKPATENSATQNKLVVKPSVQRHIFLVLVKRGPNQVTQVTGLQCGSDALALEAASFLAALCNNMGYDIQDMLAVRALLLRGQEAELIGGHKISMAILQAGLEERDSVIEVDE